MLKVAAVPREIKECLEAVPEQFWNKKSKAKKRSCHHLHFGLGRGLNLCKGYAFGAASRDLPEVEQRLLSLLCGVAPTFSSIICNRYRPGHYMERHRDGNLAAFPMQAVVRWKSPDAQGGTLHIEGSAADAGVFLLDGNQYHWVTPLTQGWAYSIVTYAKAKYSNRVTAPVLERLRDIGYPVEALSGGAGA